MGLTELDLKNPCNAGAKWVSTQWPGRASSTSERGGRMRCCAARDLIGHDMAAACVAGVRTPAKPVCGRHVVGTVVL